MVRNTTKMMLFMALFATGLHLQSSQEVSAQDAIALKMIETMQGALHINRLNQEQLAVAANQQMVDDLMIKSNQSKSIFTRSLDEYIENLGQVHEKKGIFKHTFYISSADNKSLAITPNQYPALVQTLQNAAQQSDWGKTINITFSISHDNNAVIEKNLTLNEILAAVRNVPLPIGYSPTLRGLAIGTAAGAIAVGAYYAYNNMDQLKDSMNQIENYFSSSAKQVEPTAVEPMVVEPVVETEPSFLEKFASEEKSVSDWQAGGDAENYGLSGYSDAAARSIAAVVPAFAFGAKKVVEQATNKQFIKKYLTGPGMTDLTPEVEAARKAASKDYFDSLFSKVEAAKKYPVGSPAHKQALKNMGIV